MKFEEVEKAMQEMFALLQIRLDLHKAEDAIGEALEVMKGFVPSLHYEKMLEDLRNETHSLRTACDDAFFAAWNELGNRFKKEEK